MKANHFAVLMFAVAAATGCAAAPVPDHEEATLDESSLQATISELTLAECATQRDTCLRNNPFFGFFTCPLQYTQCVATASNGLPAQVTNAISDAAACTRQQASCLGNAETAAERLACTQQQARCVADIVDANLPQVVDDTLECVEGAITCIRASESAGDLAGCAETLEDCAVDVVVDVLPPEVGMVVEDIAACNNTLANCIDAAETPAALAACNQAQIRCVASSLGVTLPPVPVAEALQCAEDAAECTLDARSAADVRACAADLVECNQSLVNGPNSPQTCEQKWTECLVRNPFNFVQCAIDLTTCRAN
jgi:hypothetical protein